MSERKDGGPAFPAKHLNDHGMPMAVVNGISMRDYFAAGALQGFVRSWAESSMIPDDDLRTKLFSNMTRASYEMSDAMLAEREK